MTTMQPVKSSQIAAIGHNPETNTLTVQFTGNNNKPGSVYNYANVTAAQFDDFFKSGSIGKHFAQHFKNNKAHSFTKQVVA